MNKNIISSFFLNLLNRRHSLSEAVSNNKIISFDIFDTLIKRKCGNPHNVFDIVEERFNSNHPEKIKNFRINRINAEIRARKLSINEEVTLSDIYKQLLCLYTPVSLSELSNLECEVEIEQSESKSEMVCLYEDLLGKKKVIITSDMYLDERTIISILKKNKISMPEKLYLSSSLLLTKKSGSLFKYIFNEITFSRSSFLHIGDNIKSDFYIPISLGGNAFLIK